MDLNYYYGNCSTSEVQSQIKHNFIQLLNETFFKEACHSIFKDKCKAENLKVTCSGFGLIPSERKRPGGMAKWHISFKNQESECFHSFLIFFF